MRTSVTTDDICIGGREHLTPTQRTSAVERGYSTWLVTTHTAGTLNQFVPHWFSLRSSGSVTGVPVLPLTVVRSSQVVRFVQCHPRNVCPLCGVRFAHGSAGGLTGSGVALSAGGAGCGFLTRVLGWGCVPTRGVDIDNRW